MIRINCLEYFIDIQKKNSKEPSIDPHSTLHVLFVGPKK